MVLASALLHAIWSATIKGTRSPAAFNAVQVVTQLAISLALLPFWNPSDLSLAAWLFLAGTGVAHALYFWFLGNAFERVDLTLAYPIIRSTPAFLPLFAVPLLGETLTGAGVAGIAVVVGGIWLVHAEQGLRRAFGVPGIGYAWLTLATGVAYSFADKAGVSALASGEWTGSLPPSLAWFSAAGLAAPIFYAPIAWRLLPREDLARAVKSDIPRAFGASFASLIGYGLILQAYTTAPASYVVAVRQTSVLFAVAIAMLFLGERPSPRRIAGAAATVAGVALIAWGG